MLLNNIWFGPVLKQWEDNKTLSRHIKYKASFLIILTFSISAVFVDNKFHILLLAMLIVLLLFIWLIKEPVDTK